MFRGNAVHKKKTELVSTNPVMCIQSSNDCVSTLNLKYQTSRHYSDYKHIASFGILLMLCYCLFAHVVSDVIFFLHESLLRIFSQVFPTANPFALRLNSQIIFIFIT